MTYGAGPRRSSPSWPGLVELSPQRSRAGAAAFTLLELVLVVAILVLLAGVMVMSLGGVRPGSDLDQGAVQFENVLLMARAEAANTGRRLRLDFDGGGGAAKVLWEPQPLEEPGKFADYTASWTQDIPNDSVRVVRSRLTGPSAFQTPEAVGATSSQEGEALASVNFYPDGSADSAQIELASTDQEDARRAVINIDGLSRTITTRILTQAELEEQSK